MTKSKTSGTLLLLLYFSTLSITNCNPDAKSIWTKAAKRCGVSDLNPRELLFLGVGTQFGPGTVFEMTEAGTYSPSFTVSSVVENDQAEIKSVLSKISIKDSDAICSANSISTAGANAEAIFSIPTSPISAELSGEFAKSDSMRVSISSFAWETVLSTPYKSWIRGLPADNIYKKEMFGGAGNSRLFVLSRVLHLRGVTASLVYSGQKLVDAKAKFPIGSDKTTLIDADAGLHGKWTSNDTLEIQFSSGYVAGSLRPWINGALAGDGAGGLGETIQISESDRAAPPTLNFKR